MSTSGLCAHTSTLIQTCTYITHIYHAHTCIYTHTHINRLMGELHVLWYLFMSYFVSYLYFFFFRREKLPLCVIG